VRDLGRHPPVGTAQEDRGPVAAEQHPGVIHHARQDLPEIELAPDVAGDPPQRLGPMELG